MNKNGKRNRVLETPGQLDSIKHLRIDQVIAVGVGERTCLRWVKAGTAPAPVRSGERAVAWSLSIIKTWLESRPVVGGAL
jgi:predicted DNA-binding transcriptional regulator AlpA